MSSRKRRIKRKIEMIYKMYEQSKRTFSCAKSNEIYINAYTLSLALQRKGWHKRAMDERHFEMMK